MGVSGSSHAGDAGGVLGQSATPGTTGDLSDSGSDLDSLPLEVNNRVLYWIDYFQGQGRPHMERYLSRSTRYMPTMKKILKEQGLPEDLIYIALIESGFSSTAHSSANAVGYWQFIRPTGKRYGLQIDNYVDERRDFVKSTKAAADYFKGLYNIFGAWYLAVASYNVGENRVKNLVVKYHSRDFWQMARENKLPEETTNYVPKFLAARLIAKEPEKYGFSDIEYMPPLEFTEVQFHTSIDLRKLAQELKVDYDDIRDLNPSYKKGVAFERKGNLTLRVPPGMENAALAAAPNSIAGGRAVYVADEDYSYYRIRRGDTIAQLARKFGTSQRQIRSLNKLSRGSRLAVGTRLRVPGESIAVSTRSELGAKRAMSGATAVTTELPAKKKSQRQISSQESKQPAARKVHIVRKGDTLTQIAHQYKVSIRELASVNQLGHKAHISVGARLEIP